MIDQSMLTLLSCFSGVSYVIVPQLNGLSESRPLPANDHTFVDDLVVMLTRELLIGFFQRYQMGIWFEYSILQMMTVSEMR